MGGSPTDIENKNLAATLAFLGGHTRIYAILLIALCILGYRFAKKKIRLYNERELEKFISDKAEEMNHAKLQFFTNITHELLTPLTIISASIEELKPMRRNTRILTRPCWLTPIVS